MSDVRLRPVTFAELSNLRHEVAVAEGPRHCAPDILVIRYVGTYRDGSEGRGDALYIVATAAAARRAWWSPCTILDFRELEYHWGDEMEWVSSITRDGVIDIGAPFAVVVGDKCRDALQSLLRKRYREFCVDTLEEAFDSCRRQSLVYHQRLKEFQGRGAPDASRARFEAALSQVTDVEPEERDRLNPTEQ